MTTPDRVTSNKTALRASLKKEDESLATRLAATDVPLVAEPEPEPVVAVSSEPVVASPLSAAPAAPARGRAAKKGVAAKSPAPGAAAKKAVTPATRSGVGGKSAKTAKVTTATVEKPIAKKRGAAAVAPVAGKSPRPRKGKVQPPEPAAAPAQEAAAGSKVGKLKQAVEEIEKTARDKGDKLVRYSVELLKSEVAAIEALRAELAKAAGWAASKSDILRAGVRVFAEQKLDQMKEVLAALSAVPKEKKKG